MALQPFTNEQLNYFKFAAIVLDEFPQALRQSFTLMWNNGFAHLPGYKAWDDSVAVRTMFLNREGGQTQVPTHLSFQEWDCTALFQATIQAWSFALMDSKCHLKKLADLYLKSRKLRYGTFHPFVISPGGNKAESFTLAIDQLRLLRNALFHSVLSQIDKKTFDHYVQLAKDAFAALGVNTSSIDAIGNLMESDFPTGRVRQLEERIRKEFQELNKFLEVQVKDELSCVRSDIADSNQQRRRELKEAASGIKAEITEASSKLKDEICGVRSYISEANKQRQKENKVAVTEMKKEVVEGRKKIIEEMQDRVGSPFIEMKEDVSKIKEMTEVFQKEFKVAAVEAKDAMTMELKEATTEMKREMHELNKNTVEWGEHLEARHQREISEIKKKIDKSGAHLRSSTSGIQRFLPKSCLPLVVPHFTGRQEECDDVYSDLTSESTRMVSIWGSPGFGKTSVATMVGHRLQSQGLPVYFLSLRGLTSKRDLTSKLLSLFGQCRTLHHGQPSQLLSPDDELCHIFSQITERFFLILDNADDLLECGKPSVKEDVINLIQEILSRCQSISLLCTTRQSLGFIDLQIQGHQSVRIHPLDKPSAESLALKLLPRASNTDCARVTQICGHVPLAIKLLCSSIPEGSPSQSLDELLTSTESIVEMLDNPDYPSNLRLKSLFESSFMRLSVKEKETLVSLSVFPKTFDTTTAAAVLDKNISNTKKLLHVLERKSLIDCSPETASFSMHKLLQSFAKEKGESEMVEVAFLARVRFYEYYIALFEELNRQFLTGNSLSAFLKFYDEENNIRLSLTQGCSVLKICERVFDVLAKSELFLASIFSDTETNFDKTYDSAIMAANQFNKDVAYYQLLVSKAFGKATWGLRGNTMEILSEAKKAEESSSLVAHQARGKRLCYHGFYLLTTGEIDHGVKLLVESAARLKNHIDHRILKLVIFQILCLYCKFGKKYKSATVYYRKAFEECKVLGDSRLLVIPEMGTTREVLQRRENPDETTLLTQPLVLLVIYHVSVATNGVSTVEVTDRLVHFVLEIRRGLEPLMFEGKTGIFNFDRYAYCILYNLNKYEDAIKCLLDKINTQEAALEHSTQPGDLLNSLQRSYSELADLQEITEDFTSALQSRKRSHDIRMKLFGQNY